MCARSSSVAKLSLNYSNFACIITLKLPAENPQKFSPNQLQAPTERSEEERRKPAGEEEFAEIVFRLIILE